METFSEMKVHLQGQLSKEGILFIIWGWLMFYVNIAGYLVRSVLMNYQLEKIMKLLSYVFTIVAILLTIQYFLFRKKDIKEGILMPVLYSWIAVFVAMSLINLIQFNVLHSINFDLQHPIFMVVIAFAIITTGNILKIRVLIYGGILFGILGFLASYLPLAQQLLLEAAGWLLTIILPGHLLYARKRLV